MAGLSYRAGTGGIRRGRANPRDHWAGGQSQPFRWTVRSCTSARRAGLFPRRTHLDRSTGLSASLSPANSRPASLGAQELRAHTLNLAFPVAHAIRVYPLSFSYHPNVDCLPCTLPPAGFHRKAKRTLPFGNARFCKRCHSEFYDSSRGGTRTPDPVINSHLLYHLSYSGLASQSSRLDPRNQPNWQPSFAECNPVVSDPR